ncbi:MAG: HEPN domain-containing protein [Nitrososphaerales archaeon]
MSIDEAEVLRERAYSFLRNAKRLFEEKEYDLAAFNLEQFCQLLLKYKLLIRTGTYPRTYSLIRILRELDAAYPEKI